MLEPRIKERTLSMYRSIGDVGIPVRNRSASCVGAQAYACKSERRRKPTMLGRVSNTMSCSTATTAFYRSSGYIEVVYKSYVSMRTCVTERTNAPGMYNQRSTQVC